MCILLLDFRLEFMIFRIWRNLWLGYEATEFCWNAIYVSTNHFPDKCVNHRISLLTDFKFKRQHFSLLQNYDKPFDIGKEIHQCCHLRNV